MGAGVLGLGIEGISELSGRRVLGLRDSGKGLSRFGLLFLESCGMHCLALIFNVGIGITLIALLRVPNFATATVVQCTPYSNH